MKDRQIKILQALIEQFFDSATPVGSSSLQRTAQFHISPATLRNEMATLEELGLLTHPHTSAGRTPTTRGYRFYVDRLIDRQLARTRLQKLIAKHNTQLLHRETRQTISQAVNFISEITNNLAFATLPANSETIFVGMANILRQPEFLEEPTLASQVFEMIERDFHATLAQLNITPEIKVFIGEENLIPNFTSCTLIALEYSLPAGQGILGILGPKRMDYALNTSLLEHIRDQLKN